MKQDAIDLDSMKQVLLGRKAELDRRLASIGDDLGEPGDRDLEDQATQRENDEVLEELGEAGVEELRQIEAALQRVDAGTYGICVQCGEPIESKRLATLPSTPLCGDCAAGR